jgi:RHS repeat-associated protein
LRRTEYMHRDHLGSIDAVPNSAAMIDAMREHTTRGFTDHEKLDGVGVVHMNGRVYDPQLGRFLSVDPVFQFPTNTQSLNPYTYVLNSPLTLTDPTGLVADGQFDSMTWTNNSNRSAAMRALAWRKNPSSAAMFAYYLNEMNQDSSTIGDLRSLANGLMAEWETRAIQAATKAAIESGQPTFALSTAVTSSFLAKRADRQVELMSASLQEIDSSTLMADCNSCSEQGAPKSGLQKVFEGFELGNGNGTSGVFEAMDMTARQAPSVAEKALQGVEGTANRLVRASGPVAEGLALFNLANFVRTIITRGGMTLAATRAGTAADLSAIADGVLNGELENNLAEVAGGKAIRMATTRMPGNADLLFTSNMGLYSVFTAYTDPFAPKDDKPASTQSDRKK